MTAHELWQNASKIRDEYRNNYRDTLADNCNEVFTQMLAATFENEDKKDELPEVFSLHYVSFSTADIELLMQRLGLTVQVEPTFYNYARGNCFKCTQV